MAHTPDEKAQMAHAVLPRWFAHNARPLPWREEGTTPWGTLLSEIMSQQTPVSRASGAWMEWMRRWPEPAALAAADSAQVLVAWGSLGYPRRALRLLECARAITHEHAGNVPESLEELRALPGIGEYTAAAIMSFAHRQRALVLDTNIRRVIARIWQGEAAATPHLNQKERARAALLLPEGDLAASRWNEAIMEFGALICTARQPKCGTCPLADICEWKKRGYPDAGARTTRPQAFEGTDRQLRGRILKALRSESPLPHSALEAVADTTAERFTRIIDSLVADGLIHPVDCERYALGSASSEATVQGSD